MKKDVRRERKMVKSWKGFNLKYWVISFINVFSITFFAGILYVFARKKPLFIYEYVVGYTEQFFWLILVVYLISLILRLQSSLDKERREYNEFKEVQKIIKEDN
jgi:hypothetical protein